MQLSDFFINNPRVAVALSGGVDSSYLLYAARAAGCDIHAYFIKTQFQPEFELIDATQIADSLGIPLTVGTLDVLRDPNVAQNPPDRCYHCKAALFTKLWELARADGFSVLCDGTNADDEDSDRPGIRAGRELGVMSPLRDCALKKPNIRLRAKQAGLFTHDKPAYSCLATRIPTGTEISEEVLTRIGRAEDVLFKIGFSDFRVRLIPPGGARLQMPAGQWEKAASLRAEILAALQPEFDIVALDLTVRDDGVSLNKFKQGLGNRRREERRSGAGN